MSPDDVLGAGCDPDDLKPRYGDGAEHLREPLARDLTTEDDLLRYYVERGRLDLWFPGVKDAAWRSVRADEEAATEAAKKRKEMSDDIGRFWNDQDKARRSGTVRVDGPTFAALGGGQGGYNSISYNYDGEDPVMSW